MRRRFLFVLLQDKIVSKLVDCGIQLSTNVNVMILFLLAHLRDKIAVELIQSVELVLYRNARHKLLFIKIVLVEVFLIQAVHLAIACAVTIALLVIQPILTIHFIAVFLFANNFYFKIRHINKNQPLFYERFISFFIEFSNFKLKTDLFLVL